MNELIMIFISFEKKFSKNFTKTQKHFNLFHAMHDFLKRTLLRIDRQRIIKIWLKNQALLFEQIEFIFNFVKKAKNNARNDKKKIVSLFISKKRTKIFRTTLTHSTMHKQQLTISMLTKKIENSTMIAFVLTRQI